MTQDYAAQSEMQHAATVASFHKSLRNALQEQHKDLLENYETLHLPGAEFQEYAGKINYLGADGDYATPWILTHAGATANRRFKMVDAYSAQDQHDLIDLTPPLTKIVVARDSATLERIMAKKDCINVVLYHKDRVSDYVRTIGKPFFERARVLITDDEPGPCYEPVGTKFQGENLPRTVVVPQYHQRTPRTLQLPKLTVYVKKE